jgi:methyl-accepting chemotaxis protein
MSKERFGSLFGKRSFGSSQTPTHENESIQYAPEEGVDRSFEYALDAIPCNAMFCDRDLILRFMNKASRKTLLTLQPYLPVPVDQIVGKSIHIFHKSQANIDRLLGNHQQAGSHKLPHKATIDLGPVKLDLNVEPMMNEDREYVGAVVMWGVSTQQTIEAVEKARESQRNDIEHLNGNLQIVATATHEIESSIAEIAQNATTLAKTAGLSRDASEESQQALEKLRASSSGVAKVAELIASIATQTSVLALNANIEAARAGAHGKGFAVVASEVRKLAGQTAAATAEIQNKVTVIGQDLQTATTLINRIHSQTDDLSGLSMQMASAAEEQHLATKEMAHNLERAAFRTSEIANMRFDGRV